MRIHSVRLTNVLSFRDETVELNDVNVLIGANGAGKTNFIECLRLLRSLADGTFERRIVTGGGAASWLWKGEDVPAGLTPFGQIHLTFASQQDRTELELAFASQAGSLVIQRERLATSDKEWMLRSGGHLRLNGDWKEDPLPHGESFFSAFRSPFDTSPVAAIAGALESIRVFSGFDTAPGSEMRAGALPAATADLADDGSNLAMAMSELAFREQSGVLTRLVRRLGEGYKGVKTRVKDGRVRLYLEIEGLADPLPAERISDGTLRFLCILAALGSTPAGSVLCFEEPETGLHPDALPLIADAIDELGEDKQVVIATHSADLVDMFSSRPDKVVVCERDSRGSHFRRLSSERLHEWLEEYSLGQLWRSGEVGGNP